MPKKWYQNWFSSPYYHIFYHQCNDDESEFFVDNLCEYLKPGTHAKLLDTACGRGSRSAYLNRKGYDVTGVDTSFSNIRFAQQYENAELHFFIHDVRYPFYINFFDIAFNHFPGFGYYESDKDHVNALKTFRKSLKKGGILVLDYFNAGKIIRNLTPQELKQAEGIDFYISKRVAEGKIIKSITFEHKNRDFSFKEEVKAFTFADFQTMFEKSGFSILTHFGDYSLGTYDEIKSDRLIFICRKSDA